MENTSNDTFQNEPPKLLDRVRGKIRLKHYSIRTEQAYLDWIKRFILHHGKYWEPTYGPIYLRLLPI